MLNSGSVTKPTESRESVRKKSGSCTPTLISFPASKRRWLKQSGGIDGKAAGISADALRPLDRLIAAFREETGLSPT